MTKTTVTGVLWFMSGWTLGNVATAVAALPWIVVPATAAVSVWLFATYVAPRVQPPIR